MDLMKEAFNSSKAPGPMGAYSPAVKAGAVIFVSGQGPEDAVTHAAKGNNIEEQTRFALDNLLAQLEAAGAERDDVVKVNVYLKDLNDFERFNQVYAGYFPDPKPARTTVGCDLINGIMIELDAVALLSK
jgi:2-iminobutanoate/2-iminopropanoate deaminase